MARILIIEDDLEISGLLSEFLLENGYQASCLYNGLHVPEVLQEYRPDLVLLDLMLPYRSGDQVLTDIRAGWAVPVSYTHLPSSLALSFIISANFSIVPPICMASA